MKTINRLKDYLWGLFFPWGIILAIIAVLLLYGYVSNAIKNHECVVVETGYYHSTDKSSRCRFIKSAKEGGYTIKRTNRNEAIYNRYKICKECFSQEEQSSYNNDIKEKKEYETKRKEWLKWEGLKHGKTDYNELYVYLDRKDVLHISPFCVSDYKELPFVELDSVSSTCEECIGAEYGDFVYKAVYEGIYDTSLIKEIDEIDTDY